MPPAVPNPAPSAPQIYSAAPPIPTPYIAPAPNNMNYGPPPAAASYGTTVPAFTAPTPPYQPAQPYAGSASPAPVPAVPVVPVVSASTIKIKCLFFYYIFF